MNVQYLIRHGLVVDGTGSPPYRGDVRVSGGQITEIGPTLEPGRRERVIDAGDCYVTPGFIETHNHWDGGMWWSPLLEPFAAYGVTTSINGNCGFSLAPLNAALDTRPDIIEIFNFFEDIPEKPMLASLPWDWRKWSEYRASLKRNVRASVNVGSFCGHIATRLAVMGPQAWERAATASEIEEMCELLEDALSAGAMGMSSNLLDYDKWDRPLPSMHAADEEWLALMGVIARRPGATLEVIIDNFMRQTGPESTERMGRLARQTGVRMQWVGMPTLKFQAHLLPQEQALHEQFKAQGLDFWTGYHHVAPTLHINFGRSLLFAQQGNQVWQEVVNEPEEDKKLAMLADPEWRRRARASWDGQYVHTVLNDPTALTLRESQTGQGPVGITLAEYMARTGIKHPSDAMAEWVLDNGPESAVLMRTWETDDELLLKMFRDPRSVGNISDAGAHGKMFCGTGDNVLLLTDWVRDRRLLKIEEAVHVLTGKLANFFGLHDRGTLKAGQQADLTVFNLAEIERRPEIKLWDVPDGMGGRTFRYTRAPAPMRLTMVNGVPTFDHGELTGNFPGEFVRPQGNPPEASVTPVRPAMRA
jgi:N-acyl-D-aspartate/D-glutamate deacylase